MYLQVYCLEIEPYMLELAQPKFDAAGVSKQIEVLIGSATDSIDKLMKRGERFDIAFLDADKTGYLGYYKQLMDNQLINPGGIVVVDNSLMKVSQRSSCKLQLPTRNRNPCCLFVLPLPDLACAYQITMLCDVSLCPFSTCLLLSKHHLTTHS